MKENEMFVKYMICTLIEDLREKHLNIEEEMKKIGHILAKSILEVVDFKRELDIQSLLYKITYNLLDRLYATNRKLESSIENKNEFFIFEYEPMYSRYVSLPEDWKDFCPESIICGVIEYTIMASGFDCEVNGFIRPVDKFPDQVIYCIKIL